MRSRFLGLFFLSLGACSSAEGGSAPPATGNTDVATDTIDAAGAGAGGSAIPGGTTTTTTSTGTQGTNADAVGGATQSAGDATGVGNQGGTNGSAGASTGDPSTSSGGVMTTGQGGSLSASGGTAHGGANAGGANSGSLGTAGAGNGGTGGALQAPSFDRTSACTGEPYAAHPLANTDMLTATPITGSETDNESGYHVFEGPAWLDGSLYFSHIASDNSAIIKRFTPPSTIVEAVVGADSNGLAIDQNANLVGATHGNQSISRIDLMAMSVTDLITSVDGAAAASAPAFNSPNDLAVRSDGIIYFTDPNWQNDERASVGDRRLYVVTTDGAATSVQTPFYSASTDPEGGPNGVALSVDEQTLYVSGNGGTKIARYPVNADGSLGTPGEFPADVPYVPAGDGMTLDCADNVYMAGDGVIFVYSSAGEELGRIQPGAGEATNAAFGGPSGTTLYITARGQGMPLLSSIDIGIPGLPY